MSRPWWQEERAPVRRPSSAPWCVVRVTLSPGGIEQQVIGKGDRTYAERWVADMKAARLYYLDFYAVPWSPDLERRLANPKIGRR